VKRRLSGSTTLAARRTVMSITLGVASVFALGGCGPSSHPTALPTGCASTAGAGDLGIGTHVGSGNQGTATQRVADVLRTCSAFDTIYLDARLVSTPDLATLRSWIRQGISPVIDLTFKNGPFTMREIGDYGPAVRAYFSTFVAGLQSLAQRSKELDNGTSVYFSFEHESAVKINQGKFVYTGDDGREPTVPEAAAAWNRVQGLVARDAPHVVRLYWFGGSATGEDEYADLLRPGLIQMATFDPYRRYYDPPHASAAELWGPQIDHLLSQPWMVSPGGALKPWGLTEWGTDRKLGDANNARFVADTLSYLEARGARFAIYFDLSDGPNDFIFTDGREPLTLRAYLGAVGGR
jgi:hypothetical protein